MYYSNKVIKHFLEALKSEYGIDGGKLVFKNFTKDSAHVYYDNELILGFHFNYIIGPGNTADVVSLLIENKKSSRVETNINEISKFAKHDEVFEDGIRRMLRRLDLDIGKNVGVVNNAQEIIEITKKAKEENIKKDIETIETKILEAARNGDESVMFRTLEFKTNFAIMNKSDNEIVKHFRNKGFECVIDSYPSGSGLLKIKWGD